MGVAHSGVWMCRASDGDELHLVVSAGCLTIRYRGWRGSESLMSMTFGAATVTVSVAIGVVCLIAGAVYLYRRSMLLGAVLIIIGILLGGLSIFGVFD